MHDISNILIARPFHAGIYYHVISHLNLEKDAASIFNSKVPNLKSKSWVDPLFESYKQAKTRLLYQGLPLLTNSYDSLLKTLEEHPRLQDKNSKALNNAFIEALQSEHNSYKQFFDESRNKSQKKATEFLKNAGSLLRKLQSALWNEASKTPPELEILDVDALDKVNSTYGRAIYQNHIQKIAVSLKPPWQMILIQIFHEMTHAVTDRQFAQKGRSTNLKDEEFSQHKEMELRAVDLGQKLVEENVPELILPYAKWKNLF